MRAVDAVRPAGGGSGGSIGEALTRARTQAGLAVTQVSDQTRIRETVITGIEGDDFSACGGELYVRGYIRTIAGAVGADPEPLIRQYEAAQLGPLAGPDDAGEPVTLIRMRERRLPGWLALLGVALALGLCFAAVHFLAGWPLAPGAAPPARARSVTHHFGHGKQATPAPDTTTRVAVAVRTLTPASAAAFAPPAPAKATTAISRTWRSTHIPPRHGIPTGTPAPTSGTCTRAPACWWTWAGR